MAQLIEHELRYKIIFIVLDRDSRTAEKLLDDLEELILETMEGDRDISGNVDTHHCSQSSDRESLATLTTGKRGRVIDVIAIRTTGA